MSGVEYDYLIWSNEHMAWWGRGGRGYVKRVREAGRYTREGATRICRGAIPGSRSYLNELPVREADVTEFTAGVIMPGEVL